MQVTQPFPLRNEIRMTPLSLEGQEFDNEACNPFRRTITAHLRLPQYKRQGWFCNQHPSWEPGKIRLVVGLEGDIETIQ